MSKAYQPNPDRVACGTCLILRDENRVFMIKRTGSHGEGTWSFPGGWIEQREEPVRAACREAWEEVGVNVQGENLTFLGYTLDKHPEGWSGITLWFETYRWDGTPRNTNPHRILDCGWFEYGRWPSPLFAPVAEGLRKRLFA